MYRLSQESVNNLSTCHSDLKKIIYESIKIIPCKVISCHKRKEQKEKHISNEPHYIFPSKAIDISPLISKKLKDNINLVHFLAGVMLNSARYLKENGKIKHFLKWGGHIKENSENLDDLFHFELVEDEFDY